MELWQLLAILAVIAVGVVVALWVVLRGQRPATHAGTHVGDEVQEQTAVAVERVFDDEFREEMRNRGRLHFEKIIGENAMFLQQDLRLTTSQLNDFMKAEITRTLQKEFAKYEQSITDAKQMAIESLNKTQATIDQQRQLLSQQIQKEFATEKQQLISQFETRMGEVVNHYVLQAIGNQIDINDQLEFILGELEANKQAIVQDLQSGA